MSLGSQVKNAKCQACSDFPLHITCLYPFCVQERPSERLLWNWFLFFLNTLSVCPEDFHFLGQLWCFLSQRGKQTALLAAFHPTPLSLQKQCTRQPWFQAAFWLGRLTRAGLPVLPSLRLPVPCPVGSGPVFELCHPGKQQLRAGGCAWLPSYLHAGTRGPARGSSPSSGALTFPTGCVALTSPNPASGVGKPLTRRVIFWQDWW